MKVNYAKPGSGAVLEDLAGNDLASFGDQNVTNGSTVPRVSIARLHPDASPGIAHAEFRVTRSNTDADNALTVNIEFSQGETYLDAVTQTISIPPGQTSMSQEFPSYYEGNTSGDLTATVASGAGYAPAIPPGNSAVVSMKVPASGKTVTISHQAAAYTVTEGGTLNAAATFTTGSGVARPRQSIQINFDHGQDTAGTLDYQSNTDPLTVAPDDWVAASGRFTASKRFSFLTRQDSEYEGDERFKVLLAQDSLSGHTFFDPVCPPGTADGRTCFAIATIVDDETLQATGAAVSSSPAGGYYVAANNIQFTVTFNGNVTVTGIPRVRL